MGSKSAKEDVRLEVDVLILDYLLHTAVLRSLRAFEQGDPDAANDVIESVDNALVSFNARYPSPPDLPDLQYRIKLLQLTTLFCHRGSLHMTTPAKTQLEKVRAANTTCAQTYLRNTRSDALLLDMLPNASRPSELPISNASTMLLDILPLFFEVSAVRAEEAPSRGWMHLAAELLLQAVLEVTPESLDVRVLLEAFAWGCQDDFSPGSEADAIQEIFWDSEAQRASPEWISVRRDYLTEIWKDDRLVTASELDELRSGYPLMDFEAQMIKYLQDLATSLEAPILTQLEAGSVLGFSEAETIALASRCGIK